MRLNERPNPLVECYACLGTWLVVARTGPGGPHADSHLFFYGFKGNIM